jgi:hypothetical protein
MSQVLLVGLFIVELLQTELKDTQSMQYRESTPPATPETFNDYEFYAMVSTLSLSIANHCSLTFGTKSGPNFKLSLNVNPKRVE